MQVVNAGDANYARKISTRYRWSRRKLR